MTNDVGHFCQYCGAGVSANDTFCPTCGATVVNGSGTSPPNAYGNPQYNQNYNQNRSASLTIAKILSILWAVVGTLLGIYLVTNTATLVDMIFEYGLEGNMTWTELYDSYYSQGFLTIGSGVTAGVAGLLIILKKYWIIAIILLALSSILALLPTTFIGTVIGFVVLYLVYSSKSKYSYA
jgi:hypothetical protein